MKCVRSGIVAALAVVALACGGGGGGSDTGGGSSGGGSSGGGSSGGGSSGGSSSGGSSSGGSSSGGSSGGSSSDCSTLASSVNSCSGESDPYVKDVCQAFSCTGSKQAVIDAVVAAACNGKDAAISAQLAAQHCTLPATCQGVAYQLYLRLDEDDPQDVVTECEKVVCDTVAHKNAALACLVSLTSSNEADYSACLTANGCPDVFK